MHVDRPRAEEEVAGDLAVRAADGDEADDLALPPRQAAAVGVRLGPHAQPRDDGLAERGELVGRRRGERSRAELARDPVGVAEALDRELALPGRGERGAGAQLDVGALVGEVEAAVQLDGAGELVGGRRRVALEQRGLADRVGQRGERVGVAGGRRDPA